MFINFTNHPSALWSKAQLDAASAYGSIVDLSFPNVPPQFSEEDVQRMADEYMEKILALKPSAVLCQGEMTLTCLMAHRLIASGVPALSACSERRTEERVNPDGSTQKVSVFVFCRYRAYSE